MQELWKSGSFTSILVVESIFLSEEGIISGTFKYC